MPDSPPDHPVRVLQVVGQMNRGGVETWLLRLLRQADRSRVAMDFLVHSEEPGAYDSEVRALGAQIFSCLGAERPLAYAKNLRRVLKQRGPYDVVHSHVHHYSGWVLSIAALAGVPRRISHSHSNTGEVDKASGAVRATYLAMMELLLRQSSTAGFACTTEAGATLYGDSWQHDPRWSVLRYGLDLERFRAPPSPSLREELGIPRHAIVVGHVGRFVELKNHAFIVAIAQASATIGASLHFLLLGQGSLREQIIGRVADLGLSAGFTFAEPSSDAVALMTNAMDCFVMPSLLEGLPVALVEAQAAGLPCLVADTVSRESKVIERLFFLESLKSAPQVWAARLRDLALAREAPDAAVRELEGGPFDIRANLKLLEASYFKRRPS